MARIDLRSDTVTHPTDAMRRAMAAAEVGDDVFGDDPTINALEARAAELLGKEAGLFVASGTMGNLVSLMAHLPRGSEAIAGASTHTLMDEAGNHAVVVGATIRPLQERPDGTMDPQDVADAWRDPDDLHEPLTGLVILEQTHAHSGGRALPLDYVRTIAAIAHERGVPLHIDGARLFNATVALGVTPAAMAAPADSVTFCLSKGLAAPVGSVVVCGAPFIARARRARKLIGGGMRQAGVLAAAGLHALDHHRERLAEDHDNARRLAAGLAALPGGSLLFPVETNLVFAAFEGRRAADVSRRLAEVGVLANPEGSRGDLLRLVTHLDVSRRDVDEALARAARVLGS
jgi:threonine aldolase